MSSFVKNYDIDKLIKDEYSKKSHIPISQDTLDLIKSKLNLKYLVNKKLKISKFMVLVKALIW